MVAEDAAGATFDQNAYFTPYTLARFDPAAEGFDAMTVDLSASSCRARQRPRR